MARNRYRQQPDEHPRPHVDIPMSLFGEFPFINRREILLNVIEKWLYSIWKRDPRVLFPDSFEANDLRMLVDNGWIVVRGDVHYWTGPKREEDWLAEESKRRTWFTYAVVCESVVKVGRSQNVEGRLEGLQTASAFPLSVFAVINGDHEVEIHKHLRHLWVSGEWFKWNDESQAYLAKRMKKGLR